MKKYNFIVESEYAPQTDSLWLYQGELKYPSPNGWKSFRTPTTVPTWDSISGKPTFATVATSGSYNDLKNKPSIPSAYSLPIATASVLGGVKSSTTGTTASRDYKVQINADGTMKVNVPWTDTNTTYSAATTSTLGLVKKAAAVTLTDVTDAATAITVGTTLNDLITKLKTSGVLS